LVGENLTPFAEGLVGRDEQGSAFIGRIQAVVATS
jgi:hypothetical protein